MLLVEPKQITTPAAAQIGIAGVVICSLHK